MTRGGLPHSEIPGSKLICSSPGLIAACHVLHRLLAPRHSPYTLSSLTIRNSKLTLPDRLHTIERATVPCNTACVVVGKNYRLQNIQLSKIRWGPSPQAPGSLACGDPKAPRRSLAGSVTPARSLAGSLRPAPSPEVSATHYVANLITSALRSGRRNYPSAAPCGTAAWHCSALDRDRRRRGRRPESLTQPRRNFSRLRPSGFGVAGMSLRCHFKELACLNRSRVHLHRGEGWWRIPGSNR